ncbi:MAG: aminoacyl-histidine dipeptidase [Eubacteriales bacterium]|nr:aminoacyl-histidine dipeptidase [Eubacteriales bacterium]
MSILGHLQPQGVFRFFEEICGIPHGSHNLDQISDYLVNFAKERGLRYRQDEAKNVIIWKDGTHGYENSDPVILQGHMDMVAVKEADCAKDMTVEGLDLAIDGDLLLAKRTSLGGDDGIAVAYALAVLDDDTLEHPPLEVIITTNEEVGLLGAAAIDVSDLKGRLFLNMDSEDEGVFTISCAGGLRADCSFGFEREVKKAAVLELRLDGFKGGHSGAEIHLGRANAIVALGRILLAERENPEVSLVSVSGGEADNAIAVFADAALAVASDKVEQVIDTLKRSFDEIVQEYSSVDPDIRLTMKERGEKDVEVLTGNAASQVMAFLGLMPNGVQRMSPEVEGLVQTSLNPGILATQEKEICVSFSVRSSCETEKHALLNRLRVLTSLNGGCVDTYGDYPGWEYKADSRLREVMVEVYKQQYGEEPVVEGIHAGLECGLFAQKLAGLDAVSFGPQMQNIHTTRERLSISSTQRTWELLCSTLKALK